MATAAVSDRTARRRSERVGLVSVLLPPAAWLASLGLSYVIQDFACTAYASAGATAPEVTIRAIILVLNVVLLVLTGGAGVLGLRQLRGQARTAVARFLGLAGVGLALTFGLGIVFIGIMPLLLEVCS